MKIVYLTMLIILMVIMLGCVTYSAVKGGKYKNSICKLLISAIIGSGFYCLFLISDSMEMAVFADGMYFFMCDVLSYFMLTFIEVYTDDKHKDYIYHKLLIAVICMEFVIFIANVKTNILFTLEQKQTAGGIVFYTENFKMHIYIHLGFCYIILAYGVYLLIRKITESVRMYKIKYLLVLVPIIILIIINAVCYSQSMPVDGSVALYGVFAVIICISTYAILPNAIINGAQAYITENINQGVFCFDASGNCVFINNYAKENECWKNDEYTEKAMAYFRDKHKEYVNEGKSQENWEEYLSVNGEDKYISLTYQVIELNKKNDISGYFIITEDRTKEIKERQAEKYKAEHDILTGLYNKEYFFEKADEIIQSNPEKKKWIIVSDIKDFKLINNIYGTEFGDEVLKLQENLVRKYMKKNTICARIAGDKFAMLIERDSYDKNIFEKAVKEIQDYVDNKKYRLCYHIGIYDITGMNDSAEKLYNNANLALSSIRDDYNRIFIECNNDIMEKTIRERNMIAEFDEALAEGQFKMFLQPQVRSTDGKTIGAEALVRWIRPDGKRVFPDEFIGVFENAGLIQKLDREMWEQAAGKIAEWNKNGITDMHISINISTKDFYYLDVYDELTKIVRKYDINPGLLNLEITESAILLDQNNNFSVLSSLREYGFELEIDDFGSGYSSFNMLKDIDFDVLKLDRVFLKETENQEKSKLIYSIMLELAKKMGMKVVAEGVENETQIKQLTNMGCDIFQGYYFDKPISVEEFEEKYVNA